MLILRIRRAQIAMADGRLDEAFGLAQASDVRAHAKGQKLIGRLARALITRGREHMAAGRLIQAGKDCDNAACLAGSLPELAQLRADLAEAVRTQQRTERHRGEILAAAREHVDNGRLSAGEQWLGRCDLASTRFEALREQVEARKARAESALARARQTIEREEWAAAAAALLEAKQAHPSDPRGADMTMELTRTLAQRAGTAADQGRLDLADSLLQPARQVGGELLEVRDLSRFLEQCREACASIERGRPRQAMEILRRLAAVRPAAGWLATAAAAAQQAAENLEHLRSGPLGLLHTSAPDPSEAETLAPARMAPAPAPVPAPVARPQGGALPSRLVFHVDGVGSYLVLRDRRITVGPAGSSRHPELALLAEPGMPAAVIERIDEDYFLRCEGPLHVNDAPARQKLLVSGDRIALSPRSRIRFMLPNAASTSAVLQLAGTRLPCSDARQVILLDREMILGPGSSAHMRADAMASPAILHVRDGRLFCRSSDEVRVDDQPMDRNAGIPLGARVQIGAVSFVVRAA